MGTVAVVTMKLSDSETMAVGWQNMDGYPSGMHGQLGGIIRQIGSWEIGRAYHADYTYELRQEDGDIHLKIDSHDGVLYDGPLSDVDLDEVCPVMKVTRDRCEEGG